MDSKTGRLEVNSTNQKWASRIETKLKIRKRRLDEILKLILQHKHNLKLQKIEDKINKKEEPSEQKGKLNLSNYKYRTRKSKKRC